MRSNRLGEFSLTGFNNSRDSRSRKTQKKYGLPGQERFFYSLFRLENGDSRFAGSWSTSNKQMSVLIQN
jgi:hypothetical protein